MKTRTTLYDLLGLPPTATEADIHAAQLRLVRHYQSGPHGMDQVDADNQIKVVKEACWILSDPGRRAAYDASLAPTQPELPPGLGVPAGVLPVDLPPPRVFKPRPPLRTMLTVTLPLMMPGVLSGCLISLASALGEFGATITFVSNVEGQTRTIPLAIYSATHMPDGDAMALRLTVVSVILALGALVLAELADRRIKLALGQI